MTVTTTTTTATTRADRRDTDWSGIAERIASQIAPDVAEADRSGEFPFRAFDLVRETGLVSMLVPADFGGGGATHEQACEVLRVLGAVDPSTAVTLSMHFHLVATQLWRHKHGQDAAKVFAKVADERAILISTGASDWVDASGTATAVEGGWRVSARKTPSSGCPAGDVLVTSIRWEEAPDGPAVIHCTVPFAARGVSIEETWDTMGMRATGSHTVVLDEVFVPEAAASLIRPAGQWHPVWNAVLGAALPLIMSAYLGAGEAMVAEATSMGSGRAGAPHVAPTVGRMINSLAIAQDAVAAMVAASDDLRFDGTLDHTTFVLARKTTASEALMDTARIAMEVTGGAGYSRSFPLERMFRDLHGSQFHPLPEAKQVLFCGRHALGLDPVGTE